MRKLLSILNAMVKHEEPWRGEIGDADDCPRIALAVATESIAVDDAGTACKGQIAQLSGAEVSASANQQSPPAMPTEKVQIRPAPA